MSITAQPLERCETCGGVYGAPDLAADPYDYPCTCPWPAEQAPVNPVLGEQFAQENGGDAWYTSDGLYVLSTTPVRAAFNAPDGRPLYVTPNPAMARPSQERELAAARAEIAYKDATIVRLQDRLARLVDQGADAALAHMQHELAVKDARYKQVIAIAEATELTPTARVTGIITADEVGAHRLRPVLGEDQELSAPQPVNVKRIERRAGIAAGKASVYLAPVAAAGYLSREQRKGSVEAADGSIGFRTTVLIGPGSGMATRRRVDPARDRDTERKAVERASRNAREAALAAKLVELEQAQAQAQAQAGCPICAGPLLPTGYFWPACGEEHSVQALARIPRRRAR